MLLHRDSEGMLLGGHGLWGELDALLWACPESFASVAPLINIFLKEFPLGETGLVSKLEACVQACPESLESVAPLVAILVKDCPFNG